MGIGFHFEMLGNGQKEDLLRKALNLLESKEFVDIIIPCLGEIVDKSNYK